MHSSARQIPSALFADIRQRLITPARALIEYSDLIADGIATLSGEELQADVERIKLASQQLYQLIDEILLNSVSETGVDEIDAEFERRLRHDLRTPINGIIGFGEMIADDLEELGAVQVQPDLTKLLSEARNLLGRLDKIVDFSRNPEAVVIDDVGNDQRPIMTDLMKSMQVSLSDDHLQQTGRILVVDGTRNLKWQTEHSKIVSLNAL